MRVEHFWKLGVSLLILLSVAFSGCARSADAQKRKHFENGSEHFAAARYREASIEFRNAVQIDPLFADARIQLAATYEKLNDGSAALGEYVRAADLRPDDSALQLTTGKYLLAARRVAEALARADAVVKREPNNIDAHVLRGNALGGLNELDEALDAIEEALRLDPARGVTYTHLGLLESVRGAHAEAERAFQKAIDLSPASADGYLALANYYWSRRRLPEAERLFEKALELEPEDQGTNRALAVFALATGRVGEAERYLSRLVELSADPASVFTLAEYYVATKRATQAVALLEPLAKESRVPGAKQRLARALAASGDTGRTTALVDEILQQAPRDSDTLLLKAQMLLDANRKDEALEVLRASVDANPASISAQFTLGRVYRARGDRVGAEAAFREVLKLNPNAVAASVELSALELADGANAASLRAAESAISQQPRNLQANIALARSLLANGQLDRADAHLKRLSASIPNNASVHAQIGVLAANRKDPAAARAAFGRALALDPASIEAFAGLIALDVTERKTAAAKSRLEERLRRQPIGTDLLMVAGRTYATLGDLDAAQRTLLQAIQMDPTVLPAYGMLGRVYYAQGRLDDARREFEDLAKRQSKPSMPLTMAAIILESQGNLSLARQRYEQAVDVDPKALVAANNLAWLYAEAGERLADATRLAKAAAELAPDNPQVLDTLGWVYYKSSLPALAVAPLTRAVAIEPARGTYRFHLGLALVKAGDSQRGRAELTRALELDQEAGWAAEARQVLASLAATATQ